MSLVALRPIRKKGGGVQNHMLGLRAQGPPVMLTRQATAAAQARGVQVLPLAEKKAPRAKKVLGSVSRAGQACLAQYRACWQGHAGLRARKEGAYAAAASKRRRARAMAGLLSPAYEFSA